MAHVPQDLLDRIRTLEREVQQLRGRAQMRPAMNQVLAGDVVIGEGGRLIVRDPDGDEIFETGQAPAGDWYTALRRDTGNLALTIGANTYEGDDAVKQMVRLWSRSGVPIVADDYYADGWLGRPAIPIPWQPSGSTHDYSGTTDAVAWNAYFRAMNAVVYLWTQTGAAGATGSMTLQLSNITKGGGWQTLDSWSVSAGNTQTHDLTFSLDGAEFLDQIRMRILHRTGSGGLVSTDVIGCTGRNTFTAAEVPT